MGRQDRDEMEDARFLAQKQFGKRLVLLNAMDAYELIQPEGEDEEYEETGARGRPVVTQEMLDQEERKDAKQMERRALEFCKEVEISHHRAEEQAEGRGPRGQPL